MGEFFRRIRYLLNRRRHDEELAGEMAFHREMAARHGTRPVGNTLRLREESRDAWGWTWIERLGQDLRFTLRFMERSPRFYVAAVLMLAVGIAINVAAFGFFNLILFLPLPVREPETLLRFHRVAAHDYSSDLPYPAMAFYRQHSRSLSAVLALSSGQVEMEGVEGTQKTFFVTANFLEELGADVAAGRLLNPALDTASESGNSVVLGYDFWQRQFGGSPGVVGEVLRLNGKDARVVGVVARSFSGLTYSLPDFWIPIERQPVFVEGSRLLTSFSAEEQGIDMWGRLASGISQSAAKDELGALSAELRKRYPDATWEGETLLMRPGAYAQNAGGRTRSNAPPPTLQQKMYPIFAMIGAFSLLLLVVACANLGSLMLARGAARQREISIRKSLGAASGRLLRQLLTESALLAAIASAAGLYAGLALLDVLIRWSGGPAWLEFRPDWRIVSYTLVVGCAAVMVFGLTPATHAIRQRRRGARTRRLLVGAQVMASCVLLIVAGLFVRALQNALYADPGFEYKQVVSIDPRLHIHGFSAGAARGYLESLAARLKEMPGVEGVSIAVSPPFGGRVTTTEAGTEGKSFPVYVNHTSPDFFATMKIPLLRGRVLRVGESRAVMVSQSLARRLWPGEDPLEKQFSFGDDKFDVVGVTGNARLVALSDSESSELYQPLNEGDLPVATLLVRTSGSVDDLARNASAIAHGIEPNLRPNIRTLVSAFESKVDSTERAALVVSMLGLAALVLACSGILGVVSFEVAQRTREIGIRVALGARPPQVIGAVLLRFALPVGAGVLLGVAGAAAISQMLVGELYGISHLDPLAYVAAAGLLGVAAALSALPAASRALQVNPAEALRAD